MALLVSVGLFLTSLANVTRVDLGLDADNLVTFGVAPDPNAYLPQRHGTSASMKRARAP
jgi:hypothetical protein